MMRLFCAEILHQSDRLAGIVKTGIAKVRRFIK